MPKASVKRQIAREKQKLIDFVLDIEKYPEFIPFCIDSKVHERNDKHTCVKEFQTHLPNLDKTIGKVVNIPVGWWVTKEEREYIVECIRKWK